MKSKKPIIMKTSQLLNWIKIILFIGSSVVLFNLMIHSIILNKWDNVIFQLTTFLAIWVAFYYYTRCCQYHALFNRLLEAYKDLLLQYMKKNILSDMPNLDIPPTLSSVLKPVKSKKKVVN